MGNRHCERCEIVVASCERCDGNRVQGISITDAGHAGTEPFFQQQGETEPLSSSVRLASSSAIGLWLNDAFLRINSRNPCRRMLAR